MLCDSDKQKANFVFRLKDKITRHNVKYQRKINITTEHTQTQHARVIREVQTGEAKLNIMHTR